MFLRVPLALMSGLEMWPIVIKRALLGQQERFVPRHEQARKHMIAAPHANKSSPEHLRLSMSVPHRDELGGAHALGELCQRGAVGTVAERRLPGRQREWTLGVHGESLDGRQALLGLLLGPLQLQEVDDRLPTRARREVLRGRRGGGGVVSKTKT